jgi:hypothetical protein
VELTAEKRQNSKNNEESQHHQTDDTAGKFILKVV